MKIVNILLILMLFIGTASAATIKVVPHTQDVQPGDPFTADIVVDPQGANVAGWEFALVFDPALVEVKIPNGVTEGPFLKPSSTFFLAGTIDNTAGKITGTTAAITTPGGSVTAPGIAATVNMKSKGPQGTSPLTLQSVTIGDINGAPLQVTIDSGDVVIVPEIASIGLVALGLIGLIGIRKYRK